MKVFLFSTIVFLSVGLVSCLDSSSNTFDTNAQFTADTTAIRNYLTALSIDAVKSPYGVWIETEVAGSGFYPSYADTITVNYTGNLLATGTQFDTQNGAKITLPSVIAGWQIGLPRLPVGASGKLYIPSGYAYGNAAQTNIPANSNLVFTIQVVNVSGFQTRKDTTAIAKYISDNNIANIIKDPSGIRYTIDTQGQGPKPTISGHVTITYTEKQLASNGTTYNSVTTPTRYYLPGMINALGIMLPKINEGSSVTLYVPSGLAYGILQNGTIPANTNLIYQIQVTKVEP